MKKVFEYTDNDEIILPQQASRKLDTLFRMNTSLHADKNLQESIINWAKELIAEVRTEWASVHHDTIDAIISLSRKEDALKRGLCRDKNYAPFRKYFKNLQKKKYIEYLQNGKKLSANNFAVWFLQNNPDHIEIPYKKSNQLHKLIQLAQANNREFKSPIECNS